MSPAGASQTSSVSADVTCVMYDCCCCVSPMQCFFTVFNLRTHWKQLHKDIPMPPSLSTKPGAAATGSATDMTS